MRRPTGRMTPNAVTLQKCPNWTRDKAAGRQPQFGPVGTVPVRCAVQPASSEDVPAHMREAEVRYHVVKFYDDPGLSVRDLIHFEGRLIVVTGVRATSGGAGRTWLADGEERPPAHAR